MSPDEAIKLLREAITQALEEFREKECNCDGEYTADGLVGYPCYFHRIEEDLKDAMTKTGGTK